MKQKNLKNFCKKYVKKEKAKIGIAKATMDKRDILE